MCCLVAGDVSVAFNLCAWLSTCLSLHIMHGCQLVMLFACEAWRSVDAMAANSSRCKLLPPMHVHVLGLLHACMWKGLQLTSSACVLLHMITQVDSTAAGLAAAR
jgi:hypothetical protein